MMGVISESYGVVVEMASPTIEGPGEPRGFTITLPPPQPSHDSSSFPGRIYTRNFQPQPGVGEDDLPFTTIPRTPQSSMFILGKSGES